MAAIGGDEQATRRVVDPIAQRFGAEAAEHDAVHGADPRAGQHRDGKFGNERQIDGHAIAFANAQRFQDVGERRHLAKQLEVGERAAIAGLAFPDEGRLVAARSSHVPIEAVDAGVERPADEPPGMRRLPVEDPIPGPRPLELRGKTSPEGFGIPLRFGVQALVAHDRARAEFRRRWKRPIFAKEIVDLMDRVSHEAKDSVPITYVVSGFSRTCGS